MFLGVLETKIMDVLWDRGEAVSVRFVWEQLNTHQRKSYAYTTIMTTLTRLWQKGVVHRAASGRSFIYSTSQTRVAFFRDLGKRVLSDVSQHFGAVAVAQFVEVVNEVDSMKLREWKRLLSQKKKI